MNHDPKHARRSIFIGLQARLVSTFVLAFLVVLAVVFVWVRSFVFSLVFDNIKRDLIATVETAAADIDGGAHARLVQTGDMDDPDYLAINELLRQVKRTNPKAAGMYTYTQFAGEPDQVRLIVSAAVPPGITPHARDVALSQARFPGCTVDPSSRPDIRTTYTPGLDIRADFLQGLIHPSVTSSEYTDAWGTWLSAFAPIQNAAGAPLAAVGLDMCVADIIRLQNQVLTRAGTVFIVVFLLLTVVVYAGAHSTTRPIRRLTEAADRIALGDYDQDISGHHGGRIEDEVSKLSQVFELMISKVREREENLKQQVTELQIIIDEGRKQQQVQEIVETDFFRELREKADALRGRALGRGGSDTPVPE